MPIKTIQWKANAVRIIDQTRLPLKCVYLDCRTVKSLWQAIRTLKVRGAPALGAAAALGVHLGVGDLKTSSRPVFIRRLNKVCDDLAAARPTAVNLFHALDVMRDIPGQHPDASVHELQSIIKQTAMDILETDRRVCRVMGKTGARLISTGKQYMTICNAGALATVDFGTALGVFYAAHEAGKTFRVFACETRPLLQGSRLTAWELQRAGVPVTLITDNMAAVTMREKNISGIFAGADRIAANGDTANKIGTYGLAVLARHHKIPFYIVAPQSTFDLSLKNGAQIPIEERSPDEVRQFAGCPSAPADVDVFNPAFDVTPARLITGFVTEHGLIEKPFSRNILHILGGA
ncbi:MAG: S-methyl-5-thioribose-1-phosphate isomerase [Candidatus Omnitrophota bacterium]